MLYSFSPRIAGDVVSLSTGCLFVIVSKAEIQERALTIWIPDCATMPFRKKSRPIFLKSTALPGHGGVVSYTQKTLPCS